MTDQPTVPVHNLLLGLAGRLDDDLLAWARELLAVGEDGQAVELVTVALAAERVALPASLRGALVGAARSAPTDLDVDRALPPATVEPGTPHRFDATAAPGGPVIAVLAALPARRLAGCRLHLTWRRTPAGAAPGPLPRAVVLVEADPDRSADVLAYLLATELDRAGTPASVEVFTTGAPLPAYHVAALHAAVEVVPGRVGARAGAPGAAQSREAVPSPPPGAGARPPARHGTADPPSAPLFLVPSPDAAEAAGPVVAGSSPEPGADGERPGGRRRRPEPAPGARNTPDVESASGASGADVGTGPDVAPAPATARPDPAGAVADQASPGPLAPGLDVPDRAQPHHGGSDRARPDRGRSAEPPDTDPFHGPLRVPLLAPLLDPTRGSVERTGVETAGVEPAGLEPTGRAPRSADTEPGPAAPLPPESPPVEPIPTMPAEPAAPADPAGPGDVPAEWEQDWRTGDWAMPRTRPQGPRDGSQTDPTSDPTPPSPHAPTPDGAFELFGALPVPPGQRDLPRRADRGGGTEQTGRTRRDAGPGADDSAVAGRRGKVPSAPPEDVSLFESPTARVEPGPPLFPSTSAGTGENPVGRPQAGGPDRPHGTPVGGDALFGPRVPDVPLFGLPPGPNGPNGYPVAPSADGPRPGRRRRPDEPTPGGSAPFPAPSDPPPPRTSAPRDPVPGGPGGPPRPDPEPSLLLNGTERDLLAQLQAELADPERRPRPYRRAGQNGSARAVNRHDPSGGVDGDRPPNLAG